MLPRCLVVWALFAAPFATAFAQTPANVVHFGQNILVTPNQTFHNATCYLCSVSLEGRGTGNIRVFAGNVFLDTSVAGHILVFGGNITLTSKASVGDGVLIFGGHLTQDPGASIHSHTVLPPIIFLPIILILCAVIGSLIVLARRMVRGPVIYPPLPRL